MIRILVTGANGQLGEEIRLLATSAPDYQFLFTDIGELDITNPGALSAYFRAHKPGIIINCAGYTAVDKAEEEKELAMQVNAAAVKNLSQLASRHHSMLVHISTDYVFDGSLSRPYMENDREAPLSAYGMSKLDGELQVLMHAGRAMILRTSWLYSTFGSNFVKTMIIQGKTKDHVNVVCDQTGTPTYARDLARTILEIIPKYNKPGKNIYHYSNEGIATWYDMAIAVVETAGLRCRVIPVNTSDFPTQARRPSYSVMDKSKIKKEFGITIPYWRDSLRECVVKLLSGS